ncbi:MAG: PKD domain-containing protein, partial [Rufibacter sp.]
MVQLYRGLLLAIFFVLSFNVQSRAADCDVKVTPSGPTTFCQGGSVVLTASIEATEPKYQWLKDGSPISGETNSTYTASASGKYSVKISGKDCAEKTTDVVTVVEDSPIADFTFTNNACSGNSVKFTNASTGTGLTYAWDFGDPGSSNSSTSEDPSHTFISVGGGTKTYNVKLTITSDKGCKSTKNQTITIKQQPDPAMMDFATGLSNCSKFDASNPNFKITVDEVSSTSSTNKEYRINWGDNSSDFTSTTGLAGVNHTYTKAGLFTLTLTVTGANGCTASKEYLVKNISNPASLGLTNPGGTTGCGPVTVTYPIASNN